MVSIKSRRELINAYLNFFKLKNHSIISSAPLIPQNDPTVLFTTAGMHPLVPFLLGEKHPLGKRLVNYQICIRTGDIDSVGDTYHHTCFEMLGNWSLGDYFKKESIRWSFEFLTQVLNIPIEKLAVTVFEGDKNAPRDKEAAEIWLSLGIPKERIAFMPRESNWWETASPGPCGPCTEIFYWTGKGSPKGNPKTNEKEWREIWNNVFMQYKKIKEGVYEQISQKNVDTGMGVERTLAILQGLKDDYLTEIFQPTIKEIEKLSQKKYGLYEQETKAMRIIADHIKAATFILAEKIVPSNTEHGYVLRRLIRRAIRHAKVLGLEGKFTKKLSNVIINQFKEDYPQLLENKEFINEELEKEEAKFENTLSKGLKEFNKLKPSGRITAESAFLLFQSFGFPLELTEELAKESNVTVDTEGFKRLFKEHQEKSRTASAGMFKSGLSDNSEKTIKYHTATHLLQAALRQVLGKEVQQRGSNINQERLRFDFSFPRKVSEEELKKVEQIVNEMIKKGIEVKKEEMTIEEAKKQGALAFFDAKYNEKVSVYTINNFSKEVCAGPHVKNTNELGKFKIIKEESVSTGVRRIKAILE